MKSLIFVYLLTYGGAAAALLNPLVGLYIYILFAILKPESLRLFAVPPLYLGRTPPTRPMSPPALLHCCVPHRRPPVAATFRSAFAAERFKVRD